MNSHSQNESILKALKLGESITQRDAIERWSCYRLSGRIFDLRHDVYNGVSLRHRGSERTECGRQGAARATSDESRKRRRRCHERLHRASLTQSNRPARRAYPPMSATDATARRRCTSSMRPVSTGWRWRNWKQAPGITQWLKRECLCATLLKLSAGA
jgi:hypothetical protein